MRVAVDIAVANRLVERCAAGAIAHRPRIIDLPEIQEARGNLSFIEGQNHIPFPISRAFWIYDVPGGAGRGAHAHRICHQVLIPAMGSFDVLLDDGHTKRIARLDRPYRALHIPAGIWAQAHNFSAGGICLVLASHAYDEADYIRSYEEFLVFRAGQ